MPRWRHWGHADLDQDLHDVVVHAHDLRYSRRDASPIGLFKPYTGCGGREWMDWGLGLGFEAGWVVIGLDWSQAGLGLLTLFMRMLDGNRIGCGLE